MTYQLSFLGPIDRIFQIIFRPKIFPSIFLEGDDGTIILDKFTGTFDNPVGLFFFHQSDYYQIAFCSFDPGINARAESCIPTLPVRPADSSEYARQYLL
jgi:hypothetical protein